MTQRTQQDHLAKLAQRLAARQPPPEPPTPALSYHERQLLQYGLMKMQREPAKYDTSYHVAPEPDAQQKA